MLQFVREIPIRIVVKEALSETRRGFLFRFAAGFEKAVDPHTGMSVNLVSVDRWLEEFKSKIEASELPIERSSSWRAYVVQQAQAFLATKAKEESAHLASLEFQEERGSGFSWKAELTQGFYFIKLSEFVELFYPHEKFDLVRLDFIWMCPQDQAADLKKLGKKLVRHCSRKGVEYFVECLQGVVGLTLPDQSVLSEIRIHFLAESYKLTLTADV